MKQVKQAFRYIYPILIVLLIQAGIGQECQGRDSLEMVKRYTAIGDPNWTKDCPEVIYSTPGLKGISNVVLFGDQLAFLVKKEGAPNYPGYPDANVVFYKADLVLEDGRVIPLEEKNNVSAFIEAYLTKTPDGNLAMTYRIPIGLGYGYRAPYRVWNGSQFIINEEIYDASNWGVYPHLFYRSDKIPRYLSFSYAGYHLTYSERLNTGWRHFQVGDFNNLYRSLEVFLDENGTAHIFGGWTNSGAPSAAQYLKLNANSTIEAEYPPLGTDLISCDISIQNSQPYLLYFQGDSLRMATKNNGIWQPEAIAAGSNIYQRATFLKDQQQDWYVAFYNEDQVQAFRKSASSWEKIYERSGLSATSLTMGPTLLLRNDELLLIFNDSLNVYKHNLYTPCMPESSCRTLDSLELVKLYNATGGPNWTNTWDLSKPMDTWYGVTLSGEGCVECIDMDGKVDCLPGGSFTGNNLVGNLPDLKLDHLTAMILPDNQLIGPIPDFNMPNLTYLNLGQNQLSGSIPNFNLPNLQSLILFYNQLSGTIPNFNLPNLKELSLISNQLSGSIPNFNLPNLEYLHLGQNQLGGNIPNFNLPNLTNLYLFINQLSGSIPDFDLPNLTELYLTGNQLSGSIPGIFQHMKKLAVFHIANNRLDSLPNLSALPFKNIREGLTAFQAQNNRFTFDDILPNIGFADASAFLYAPQNSIFRDTTIRIEAGKPLAIDLGIDAGIADNRYAWTKNRQPYKTITGSNKLEFDAVQTSDAGTYRVQVTNPRAPELVLVSRDITLEATCADKETSLTRTICDGQQIDFQGQILDRSGFYETRIALGNGCDSLVKFNLTVLPALRTEVQESVCPGSAATFLGKRYDQTGIYRDTIRYTGGCDSLIGTLQLTALSQEALGLAQADAEDPDCESATFLTGNQPSQTQGRWIALHGGEIDDPGRSRTSVRQVPLGQNGFVWSLSTTKCPDYHQDTVYIFNEGAPEAIGEVIATDFEEPTPAFEILRNDRYGLIAQWTYNLLQSPEGGTLESLGKGVYRFFPARDFSGEVKIPYEICSDLCCDTTALVIRVGKPVDIPEGITPNGDGINDQFVLEALMPDPGRWPDSQLYIYNGQGDLVYKARPYYNNWEGTTTNGRKLPEATYYYVFTRNGQEKPKTGRVVVLR